MKTILKATVFTAAGALLALPAMAQTGNASGSYIGSGSAYHADQYNGTGNAQGQHGRLAYNGSNGWQNDNGSGQSFGNSSYNGNGLQYGNNGSSYSQNNTGWQGQQQNGEHAYNNQGNSGWHNNQQNWRGAEENGERHDNWRSAERDWHRHPYEKGFEHGFDTGFSQGFRAGFMHARHENIANRDAMGSATQGTETQQGALNGSGGGGSGTAGSQSGSSAMMSQSQIRSQLQQLGYTNVQNLQQSGDTFTATAQKDGQSKQLTVDGKTGSVITATNAKG